SYSCSCSGGEVVDGGVADGLGLEVVRDPTSDLTRGTAATTRTAAESTLTTDEVVDLALRNQFLELGQCGRRVGAVEPTDRHDRLAGRDLQGCGTIGGDGSGRPGVALGAVLQ